MIFIAKPDYADYEMISEITVVAYSTEEAVKLAEKKADEVNSYLSIDRPQKWEATPIERCFKGTLSYVINW